MSKPFHNGRFGFGPFQLDADERVLLRDGLPVPLPPKALETLLVLVEKSGHLVEKDALMKAVWPDTFVEEGNLTVHVALLRKTLGEMADGVSYIETVPRRGYRFNGAVRLVNDEAVVRRRTRSRIVSTTLEEQIAESPATKTSTIQKGQTTASPGTSVNRWLRLPRTTLSVASVGVILLLAGILYFSTGRSSRTAVAAPVKSIAVLPFRTIGAGEGTEHQGLGMADILITRLSNIKELNVRPTSSVMNLGDNLDSVKAGAKLQVDAVLEGTIYRANDNVRVTAQLIRVSDQSPIWAAQFEKPLRDELEMQNEIANQLVEALALNLSANEKRILTYRYTENAEAYQLYIKGRYHWNKRSTEGTQEALRLFRNAIEKDPNFALAYVGLADTIAMNYNATEAAIALEKAIELDPNLAEAYASRGFLDTFHSWNWQSAEANFKKSIEMNSGYATAHHWYATLLEIQGRTEEAKTEMRRALEIDPLSHNFLADLGQAHYFAREYDLAEEYCRKALEIYPEFQNAYIYLFEIYLVKGDYENALDALVTSNRIMATFSSQTEKRKELLSHYPADQKAKLGRANVRNLLISLTKLNAGNNPNEYLARAKSHARLEEKDAALDDLERALEARAFLMPFVKVDPGFDNLRSEPRYQEILRKMKLL